MLFIISWTWLKGICRLLFYWPIFLFFYKIQGWAHDLESSPAQFSKFSFLTWLWNLFLFFHPFVWNNIYFVYDPPYHNNAKQCVLQGKFSVCSLSLYLMTYIEFEVNEEVCPCVSHSLDSLFSQFFHLTIWNICSLNLLSLQLSDYFVFNASTF